MRKKNYTYNNDKSYNTRIIIRKIMWNDNVIYWLKNGLAFTTVKYKIQ